MPTKQPSIEVTLSQITDSGGEVIDRKVVSRALIERFNRKKREVTTKARTYDELMEEMSYILNSSIIREDEKMEVLLVKEYNKLHNITQGAFSPKANKKVCGLLPRDF